ncbi:DUF6095 family protein [Capnocytophaga canimorsus]|uniref:DUF6095 family protein n=1 Tax=Capnocytophaga canimorsus TaxID=28188 RepID=UPI00385AF4A5
MIRQGIKKGFQFLAISLPCLFLGPVVIHSAFTNKAHPLFIPVLLTGIAIACFGAIIGFKGIRKMVESL